MKTLTNQVGGGNPFAAGGSTAMVPVNMTQEVAPMGFKGSFFGVEINFATEADYLMLSEFDGAGTTNAVGSSHDESHR